MDFGKIPGDREAKTRAATFAGPGGLSTVEAVEDAGQVGGGYSGTGVRVDSFDMAAILATDQGYMAI